MKRAWPLLALQLLGQVCAAPAAAPASEHPNILWLSSEDHGPQMGCYGDRFATTPNVDALAGRGSFFKHAR